MHYNPALEEVVMKKIDVRSLACPGPVLKLRDLLDGGARELTMVVGDGLACSNVGRFAKSRGSAVHSAENEDGSFTVTISMHGDGASPGADEAGLLECDLPANGTGPVVVQIGSRAMGKGDDDLGQLLLKSFIKTIQNLDQLPATMVFYNSGVHLCCSGSPVLDDLTALGERGVEVLACGTCLNFFEIAGQLKVGRVTDMLEIGNTLAAAGTTIQP